MNLPILIWRWPAVITTLSTLLLTLSGCNIGNPFVSDPAPTAGTITLISDGGDGAENCTHTVSNMYIHRASMGCGLKSLKYINLTAVPSATTVRFFEASGAKDCRTAPVQYSIELKTRGPYSSNRENPLNIQAILQAAQVGQVIDRNLQISNVVRRPDMGGGYDYLKNLDCIQIGTGHSGLTTSQAPSTTEFAEDSRVPGAVVNAEIHAPYGSLRLTDFDGNICDIPITGADIRKSDSDGDIPGCNFKRFEKMQLVDVPSAITIYVGSYGIRTEDLGPVHNDCFNYDNWQNYAFRILIKTTGAIVGASSKFDIDDMISTPPDHPIIENLRLRSYDRKLDRFDFPTSWYFSCFKFDLGHS